MHHIQQQDGNITVSLPLKEREIYLVGTFSQWQVQKRFKMQACGSQLILTVPFEQLNKIGNSGYIEFYFWDEAARLPLPIPPDLPAGYYFNNQCNQGHNLLLFPTPPSTSELLTIADLSNQSLTIKQCETEFDSVKQLANFRAVTGGALAPDKLYRSYHPVLASRQSHPQLKSIEIVRQKAVRSLFEQAGIRTVINLSETTSELVQAMETAPNSAYKQCWQERRVHCVPMAYETVYFMSDRDEPFLLNELGFQSGIREVINIVASQPGPYLVHCRLGSDRTGVVSAFLQLLMGAGVGDVEQSYLTTNQLGIGEYRSFKLLRHALITSLGIDCFEPELDCVGEYLAALGILPEIIERARVNLAGH